MRHALFYLLLLASPLLAGPDSQGLGEKLADLTGAQKMLQENFMASIDNAIAQMKGGDPELIKAIKAATQTFYDQHYQWEDLRSIFGRAYAAEFSDEEMKMLITFYDSPLGKKAVDKFPAASRLASQLVAEKMKDKSPLLQATLMELVRKHVGTAPLPPAK